MYENRVENDKFFNNPALFLSCRQGISEKTQRGKMSPISTFCSGPTLFENAIYLYYPLQHQHDNEIETARTKLTFQISSYHTLRKILQNFTKL